MNKVGESFDYLNSFLLLSGYTKIYRHFFIKTEWRRRDQAENKIPSIPDYNNIDKNINQLDIHVNNKLVVGHYDDFIISINTPGVKVINRGKWMRHKWHCKSRKEYLKIYVHVIVSGRKNNYEKKSKIGSQCYTEKLHDLIR